MRFMKIMCILSPFYPVLLSSSASARPPETMWSFTCPDTLEAFSSFAWETDEGDFLCVGKVMMYYGSNLYAVRLDAGGNPLWSRYYFCELLFFLCDAAPTSDGGFVAAGQDYLIESAHSVLAKVDANGEMSWSRTYGYSYNFPAVMCVAELFPDGYITYVDDEVDYLLKVDDSGYPVWNRVCSHPVHDLLGMPDGGFVVAGSIDGLGSLERADSLGNILWTRTLDCASAFCAIDRTADGGYALLGLSSPGTVLIKTDAAGSVEWSENFEGGTAHSVEQTWDGGYLVCADSAFSELTAPVVIRTDPVGQVIWQQAFPYGQPDFFPKSASMTADGGCVVAGMPGFRIVRLAPELGVEEGDSCGGSLELSAPSPNPFAISTELSYELEAACEVDAEVFSVSGELVAELADGFLAAGQHSLAWNGTDASGTPCPAGVYLVRVTASGSTTSRNIVLLR